MGDLPEALGEFALGDLEAGKHPARGAQDGLARGIVDGDAQVERSAGEGGALDQFNGADERGWDAVAASDYVHANSGGGKFRSFRAEEVLEQAEQRIDFA